MRLIDAEELKHILNNSKYYGTKAGNAFADMIYECTTIEERKKGKWIEVQRYRPTDRRAICECSVCHDTLWVYDEDGGWNFCPNCGADMRGDGNE